MRLKVRKSNSVERIWEIPDNNLLAKDETLEQVGPRFRSTHITGIIRATT